MRGLMFGAAMLMAAFAPPSAIDFVNLWAGYFGISLAGLLAMPGSAEAIFPASVSWGLTIAGGALAGAALRRKLRSLPRTTA